MAEFFLTKTSLSFGSCLVLGVLGSQSLFAQTVPQTDAAPASNACAGVLCSLTPGSMGRPILADEANRIEADRASRPAIDPVAAPSDDVPKRRHATHGGRHAANGPYRRVHAVDGRSVAARVMPLRRRPAEAISAGPINTIFVLAPRPFDPYGGDYAPWLDRLAWPNRSDRAGDRTVFSADGYREAETAPAPEPARPAADATDDLARRTNALSLLGFQALKADLGGS